MGLTESDGRLIAVVRMCEGATSDRLVISGLANQIPFFPPTWRFDALESGEIELGDIAKFAAAVGEVESAYFSGTSSVGVGPYIRVSQSDLAALAGGGILAEDLWSRELTIMDELTLEDQRDAVCEYFPSP